MGEPLLLRRLQDSLSCLYTDDPRLQHGRHDAHAFLVQLKTSNVRRQIKSTIQSQRDSPSTGNIRIAVGEEHAGSVYLSCLALLLQSKSTHERIFCAQSLNNRCRSIKLVESYDLESEDGIECGVARLVIAWEEIKRSRNQSQHQLSQEQSRALMKSWVERYSPVSVFNYACVQALLH
ncbi:hypothetical protein THAOC_21716 [Thalassiosira oceanica]|uniref:Uncharacterized protein n=1 Tax=Thalassiosira oceanica TaxID=159749 RepID=K0RWP6_THAOC|nr:hypothetical protein THAOC_21716 [Thalassiosira oceanica]|eukprot:EJK58178.1 hypothetical protein THAOC_21716 [Thalassiosira oceanica]